MLTTGQQNIVVPPRSHVKMKFDRPTIVLDVTTTQYIPLNLDNQLEYNHKNREEMEISIEASIDSIYSINIITTQVFEDLDHTPLEVAVNGKPPSLRQEMRSYVTDLLQERYGKDEFESFDESDDFDIDDEIDLTSKYEMTDMIPEAEIDPELQQEPVSDPPPDDDLPSDDDSPSADPPS